MSIKTMIERIIALRNSIPLTLLAICPNSEAVLEAAVITAQRNHTPILFAATLNQVDRDGGYTGWTPQNFVTQIQHYAKKHQVDETLFYPCLDHGGQWLKDTHQHLPFEDVTQEVKHSIRAMLQAGYKLLHIDATKNPESDSPLPVETVVERTLDLITYAENERQKFGLPEIAYEVGTEEVDGGLVDFENFRRFLKLLYAGLESKNLSHAAPSFIVARVGTDLQTTRFEPDAARKLYAEVVPYKALIKGHYTDWVENPAAYPETGMGGANIGPEFTAVEFTALQNLAQREADLIRTDSTIPESGYLAAIKQAVIDSNRWQKWLQDAELGKALGEIDAERQAWIIKTCARYVWTDDHVLAARKRLYTNLQPIMGNPHEWVVQTLVDAMEHYVVAFHLFNAAAILPTYP